MILNLPTSVAEGYKSASQKARVITEAWALENMYCPACVSDGLDDMPGGTEAVDFVCPRCSCGFQLKAMSKPIGRRIVDAAYDAMIRAILGNCLPHFLLLSYDFDAAVVNDLVLIPSFCLPPSAIEKRSPLAVTARRAGWVGCNIILDLVPPEGRIGIVRSGTIVSKSQVRRDFKGVQPLGDISSKKRGWTLDVLTVLRSLGKPEFSIDEAYSFKKVLSKRHPENRHVQAKIRQQLQILRDMGYLEFAGHGYYRWSKVAT